MLALGSGFFRFASGYHLCMTKRSKKNEKPLWWIEGRGFTHRGIKAWFPIYCSRSELMAKGILRQIESGSHSRDELGRYDEFRVGDPDQNHYEEMLSADRRAAKGRCPNCDLKSKKHQKGRWKGYSALRCCDCTHVWAVSKHEDHEALVSMYGVKTTDFGADVSSLSVSERLRIAREGPTSPLDASKKGSKGKRAKKRVKKGRKAQKKTSPSA